MHKHPKEKNSRRRRKRKIVIFSSTISYTKICMIKNKRRVKMMTMMMVNAKKKMIDNN
jgi:hypothetical protein